MEKRTCFLVIFFALFFLSSFVQHNLGQLIRQTSVLADLYKEKWKTNSNIDKGHFNASHHAHKIVQIHPQDNGCKERDRIERLPGQPADVEFKQYGGYITVNQSAGTAFYYYFVEAQPQQGANKSLPLLLWLNGGPGCSSLSYGAMQELGPFRVHKDGETLFNNKFAWNYAANVLFVESPAGVGFSYSNTTEDYANGGDIKTATYNLGFLLNWFERFPEYKGREFYIAGESYAGHYVPQLAHTILYHNKISKNNTINFKGIIIGNAVIDDEEDTKGMYDYLETHALISDNTAMKIHKYCDFSHVKQSSLCHEATSEANENIRSINIYNIYEPRCSVTSLTNNSNFSENVFDPCSDNYVYAYLNRHDVQKALHANITKMHYDWQPCSYLIQNWTDSPVTIIPILRELMANGIRVWIFSGDTDARVPVTSTKYSLNKMKLKVKTPWHSWVIEGEVGGYTQVYEGNVTFATVRGAGHQVPSYQPARALSLVMHFLSNTDLPPNKS